MILDSPNSIHTTTYYSTLLTFIYHSLRNALQRCFFTINTTGQTEESAPSMRVLPSAPGSLRWWIALWPVSCQQDPMQQADPALKTTFWHPETAAGCSTQSPASPVCAAIYPDSRRPQPTSEAKIQFTTESIHKPCCHRSSAPGVGFICWLYLSNE